MLKPFVYMSFLVVVILGTWQLIRGPVEVREDPKPPKSIEVIIYDKGRQIKLDSTNIPVLVTECERLFTEADDILLLIMTPDRIQDIKKNDAIEILYPSIQTKVIIGKVTHFTKLLIPLSGEFATGMVFYDSSAQAGMEKENYPYLQQYGTTNFVRNSRGIEKLKAIIQKTKFDNSSK